MTKKSSIKCRRGRRKKTRKDIKKKAVLRNGLGKCCGQAQKAINKLTEKARESYIKALSWPYYHEDNKLNSLGRSILILYQWKGIFQKKKSAAQPLENENNEIKV